MDLVVIAAAGVGAGTILLFAAVGEIFAERAGVINLGVEGMMFMGAVSGFAIAVATGNPYIGLLAAMFAGGLLALLHGIVTIHLGADQIVSRPGADLPGDGRCARAGRGLVEGRCGVVPAHADVPLLVAIPILGPIFFTNQSVLVYVGYSGRPGGLVWINGPGPGCICGRLARTRQQPTRWASTSTGCATRT